MGILGDTKNNIGNGFGLIYVSLSELNDFLNDDIKQDFLLKLLDSDYYYEYLIRLFRGEVNRLDVVCKDDMDSPLKFTKTELLEMIKHVIEKKRLFITPELKDKLEYLISTASYEKLKKDKKNKKVNMIADGQDLTYTYDEFFSFLELPEEEYLEFVKNNELFIYVIRETVIKSGILNDYVLPDYILNRLIDIISYSTIDIEHVNNISTTIDPYLNEVILNENFKKDVLSAVPSDFDDLEKAIFVYIILCQKLTYDEAFYAMNQTGEVAKIHEDIARIKSINSGNNSVVCYEVNAIYGKLLHELGINYAIVGSNYENYAGHTYLKFKAGKFLVSADSVTSIIGGDLANAKIGSPLVGIKCLNVNEETKKDFEKRLFGVYKRIYGDFYLEYDRYLEEHRKDDILSKIRFVFDITKTTKLSGIDKLSLFIHAYSKLLKDEKHKHTELTIVRRLENERAETIIVLTINFKDRVDGVNADNTYYVYDGNTITTKSKDELEEMIKNKDIEYIDNAHFDIPGINRLNYKI